MTSSASAYPYDTVVRITDRIGAQEWQGSGVLISPDEVLTASHVVYMQGVGTATDITVTPGYDDGSSPYGSTLGASFHYFPVIDANDLISNQQSQSDYAVIHLSTPFETAGTMGIESNFPGGSVNITGYPASAGGDQVTSTQTVSVDPNYTLLDGTSIGDGSSGGPVWVETDSGPEVVGLVSSSASDGTGFNVQITTSVLDQIEAWVAEDDGSDTVNTGASSGTGGSDVVSSPRFNPGGSSPDILWQNADGQAAIWDMSGTNVAGGGTVTPNPGANWTAIGTGDFNDDGNADILWRNTDGQAAIWDMNGTSVIGGGAISPNPGPSWTEIATGDFNDDGHSDILWQNADGQAAIWDMNGTNVTGGGTAGPNPGSGWRAVGTGDFTDDGHSDILWQNTDGQVAIWEMNGNNVVGGGLVGADPGSSWKAVGTGDFNDDGHSDILFQGASGQAAIWEMNGTNVIGGGTIALNPGLGWTEAATGDFNGDGHSDILWQNANGQAAIWEMSGSDVIGGGVLASNPGPSWRAV
jgi:V8-like Glu-specific endopeptidase